MNKIQYLLDRIFLHVPRRLLELTFTQNQYYDSGEQYSLESRIEYEVIQQYFMSDLNVMCGERVEISLISIPYQEVPGGRVYRIPLSSTQGRHLTNVWYTTDGLATFDAPGGPGLIGGFAKLTSSVRGAEVTGTERVYLKAPNTVFIAEQVVTGIDYIEGRLEVDPELLTWNPNYLPELAQAAVLLTKMLIYVRLNTEVGDAASAGSTNEYIRSAISQYEDAAELYKEMVERTLPKIGIMQDRAQMEKIIQMQIML